MTKPIIGIIGKNAQTNEKIKCDGNIVFYEYMNVLDNENASYLGLITNEKYDFVDDNILKLCDGFIMQGGNGIKNYHFKILEHALKYNKPFLGICLGAQAIGLSTLVNAKLLNLEELQSRIDHSPQVTSATELSKPVHKVKLMENSILYNMFGSEIEVNSNHQYALPMIKEPLKITGISEDCIIEAIEHVDADKFIVGVQWHPERMESMQPLFKEFINKTIINKDQR